MIANLTQRWRETRESYRKRGEAFNPSRFGVELIDSDTEARDFVARHHYSGSYPAARLRVGLYRQRAWIVPELVGIAVFSVGVQPAAVPAWVPGLAPAQGIDLGRFVLLDDVPFNGETWFLRRAFSALAVALTDVRCVLSYSDPLSRRTEAGHLVTPGHVGAIYQAKGARYAGRTRANWILLDGAGRTLSARSLSKIRLEESGHEAAARALVQRGAPKRTTGESNGAWLERALREGAFRRVRHPGQHVYLFAPDGRALAGPALAYPKKGEVVR
jgi:hypothetical protein